MQVMTLGLNVLWRHEELGEICSEDERGQAAQSESPAERPYGGGMKRQGTPGVFKSHFMFARGLPAWIPPFHLTPCYLG